MPVRENGDDICIHKLETDTPCFYEGAIRSAVDGSPIPGAIIDVWLTSSDGLYAVQAQDVEEDLNLYGR